MKDLDTVPRLLLEAELQPLQGTRFQPTGFPDIGAAEYETAGGATHLLVESAPSMANRLEAAIWDTAADDLVAALAGMPYVKGVGEQGATNSILESHRLNSPYLLPAIEGELIAALGWNRKSRPDPAALAAFLFKHDPNSVLHGVFFSNLKPGGLKLSRLLSAFIEAEEARPVSSGGVKLDRLDPSGEASEGKGHIPFHRVEYTAARIVAYFNLDLHRLRAYGLGKEAEAFLITLSLYKLRRFLDVDLRLRTACDLQVRELRAVRPSGFELASEDELARRLKKQIASLGKAGCFARPAVREVKIS